MPSSLTGISIDQVKSAAAAARLRAPSPHQEEMQRTLLRSLLLFEAQYRDLVQEVALDDYLVVRASLAADSLDRLLAEGADGPSAWEAARAILTEDLLRWETADATSIDPATGGYR